MSESKIPMSKAHSKKKKCELIESPYEIVGLCRRNIGKKKSHYKHPDKKDLDRVYNLIDAIIESKKVTDDLIKLAFENGFAVIRTQEDQDLYMFSPYNVQDNDLTLMWRFSEDVYEAFVEYNHAMGDGAEGVTANAILTSKCRGALLNALSSDCGNQRKNGRAASDSSHSAITMFSKVHCYLASKFPNSCFFQFHGMVGNGFNFCVLVNSGAGRDDPEKSICVDFSNALDKLVTKEQRGKIVFSGKTASKNFRMSEKIITTNVQGRALHNGKGDSGRFAHVELSVDFRKGRRMDNFRKITLEAIRKSFEEWSRTPIKNHIDVLDDDYIDDCIDEEFNL